MSSKPQQGLRKLIGISVDSDQPGTSCARLSVTSDHLNASGVLHGGAIATLCDSAMGHAVGSLVRPQQSAATATLNLTYLNRAEAGDELEARAAVRKRGRRIVIVESTIVRVSDGAEIAAATATFGTFERSVEIAE